MKLTEFHYDLPAEQIAQRSPAHRDASRTLYVSRNERSWQDSDFRSLPQLLRGDELIVVNNARVIPARLFGKRVGVRAEKPGRNKRTVREYLSSEIEVLLTKQVSSDVWEVLVRPGKKMQLGERVVFGDGELSAEVIGRGDFGLRRVRLTSRGDLQAAIERLGHIPLPPYISRADEAEDRERYQTIFASNPGAVAAPTAGLHFSHEIVEQIQRRGIEIVSITLKVGLGTFQPIHAEEIEQHRMHAEPYEIPEASAQAVCKARREARPILAVGTTVVRALESAAAQSANSRDSSRTLLQAGIGEADIYITPGYTFRVVDQMLTNFHLPESTLLILVSAFAGRELMLDAYRHAVKAGYRFYSYGDCMLIR